MSYPLSITFSPHESYQMGNGICSIVILITHLCLEGGKNQTEKHMTSPLNLVCSGWRKAAVSQHRWDSPRQLGLQHLWPEEFVSRRSSANCAGTNSCRGHGPPQYRGTTAGAPQWPAWPVPSPWWGLYLILLYLTLLWFKLKKTEQIKNDHDL